MNVSALGACLLKKSGTTRLSDIIMCTINFTRAGRCLKIGLLPLSLCPCLFNFLSFSMLLQRTMKQRSESGHLQHAFEAFDSDHDGQLSHGELAEVREWRLLQVDYTLCKKDSLDSKHH